MYRMVSIGHHLPALVICICMALHQLRTWDSLHGKFLSPSTCGTARWVWQNNFHWNVFAFHFPESNLNISLRVYFIWFFSVIDFIRSRNTLYRNWNQPLKLLYKWLVQRYYLLQYFTNKQMPFSCWNACRGFFFLIQICSIFQILGTQFLNMNFKLLFNKWWIKYGECKKKNQFRFIYYLL